MTEIRIATRRSALALAQARHVAGLIEAANRGVTVTLLEVDTLGDRDQAGPIVDLTEIGAFVRSVQRAVIEGSADLAVHSLKDLPVSGPPELEIVAIPERASPHDVLVGATLGSLPEGAVIGTGSPRRSAQLLDLRPDLKTTSLRGNVDTRLGKIARREVDAAVLAEAGLERLGRTEVIAQRFATSEMVPAPGQAALAVEACRESDAAEVARSIDDPSLRTLVSAERLLLAATGAGCRSALGALATWERERIRLETFVADEGGARRSIVYGETPATAVAIARQELAL
jgi:hydroxymethylbilane synthase